MFTDLAKVMNSVVGGNKAGQFTSVQSFVTVIANGFILIAFGISVISIALSFIQYTTSAGDPKAIEKAQSGVLWGALGVLLSLSAFALKNILINAAGITNVQ